MLKDGHRFCSAECMEQDWKAGGHSKSCPNVKK